MPITRSTYILLFSLIFIEAAGGVLFPPLVSLQARQANIAPIVIASFFSFLSASLLVSSSIGGWLSDKIGRKKLLISTALAGAVAWLLMSRAQATGDFIIAALFLGLAASCLPIVQSYVVVGKDAQNDRTVMLGFIGTIISVSAIFAPFATSLFANENYSLAYFIIALAFALIALCMLVFLPNEGGKTSKTTRINFSLREELRTHKILIPGYLSWFIFGLAMSGTNAIFTLYMKDIMNIPSSAILVLFAAGAFLSAISQTPGLKYFWLKLLNEHKIIFILPLLIALCFLFMAAPMYGIFLAGFLLEQLIRPAWRITMISDLSHKTEENKQGGALGALSAISALSMIIGPIMFGYIFSLTPSLALIVAGVVSLVSFVFAVIFLVEEKYRRRPLHSIIRLAHKTIFAIRHS